MENENIEQALREVDNEIGQLLQSRSQRAMVEVVAPPPTAAPASLMQRLEALQQQIIERVDQLQQAEDQRADHVARELHSRLERIEAFLGMPAS
jgi:hypothetical protein